VGSILRSTRNFIYKRILHADDSPRNIAMGVAVGLFVAFTPTMGAQMAIAIALAAIMRGNKAVALPVVWVTNPVTFVPLYGFCWWIGSLITGGSSTSRATVMARLREGSEGFFGNMLSLDFWAKLMRLMAELGVELWIGCLVAGIAAAIAGFFLTRWGVASYRVRRHERLSRGRQRREERRQARAARKLLTTGDPT